MTPRERLDSALATANDCRLAGDFTGARRVLQGLAGDPGVIALLPQTALGLPRKLHAAWLRLAKAEGDAVARAGYQFHLVPPVDVLAALVAATATDSRAVVAASARTVPRLIHQVWIGRLPVPPAVEAWRAHAAAQGYDHRLWREADLDALGCPADPVFRDRLARGDFPGAVDAARYAILALHGGIYLDCDWYPARHDLGFHHVLPMTGLMAFAEDVPRLTGKGPLLLANSFIAAPPEHPVLERLRDVLPKAAEAIPGAPAWWVTGPLIFTLVARRGPLTLADAGLVAGSLPDAAPLAEAEAAARQVTARDGGLLLAWKSW